MTVKLPDTLYVGTRAQTTASGLPLGFAVPDGTDSGARKRKETVDYWSDTKTGQLFANKPRRGFQLVDWKSRYGTDNKVVRIVDPNGYELEIYIPNLMALVLTCKIDKGVIDADLVWIRDGAVNRLVRSDDPVIEVAATPTAPRKKVRHAPGDIVESKDERYLYLGLMNVDYIIPQGPRVLDQYLTDQYYDIFPFAGRGADLRQKYYKVQPDDMIATTVGRKHVYMEASSNYTYRQRGKQFDVDRTHGITFRTSQMTTYAIESSGNPLPALSQDRYWWTQHNMIYDDKSQLFTTEQAYAKFGGGGRDRFMRYHDTENRSFWRTHIVRFMDGVMTAPIDATKLPSDPRQI